MIDIDRMSCLGISLPEIQINNDDVHREEESKEGFCSNAMNIISSYEHYADSLLRQDQKIQRP